jgi:2-iminobutanoate/2-iminopropanoate deaminase
MKQAITTTNAPGAIGPYSQAIKANGLVFLSGQIPLDPASGQMVEGDAKTQTEQVMKNLRAVLEASGCTFDDVVRSTIFLTSLGDFQAVNEVYAKHFTAAPPARATVQVAALPRGAKVEIDMIAAPAKG